MKKSFIILGCVIALVIILFVIKTFSTTSVKDEDYLNKYLEDNGYVENTENKGLYTKIVEDDKDDIKDAASEEEYNKLVAGNNNVEYTTFNLDPSKFVLIKENRNYSENIEKIYNGTVDLKGDKVVKFDYLINIYTSQVMVEGTYEINEEHDDNIFTCSLYYQSDLEEDEKEVENLYCLLAKLETLDFVGNINELKSDKRIYSMINE